MGFTHASPTTSRAAYAGEIPYPAAAPGGYPSGEAWSGQHECRAPPSSLQDHADSVSQPIPANTLRNNVDGIIPSFKGASDK